MPHERTTRTGGTGRNGHRTVTFHDVPDAPAAASRTRARAGANAQSGARYARRRETGAHPHACAHAMRVKQ